MEQQQPEPPDERDLRLARLEGKLADLQSRLPKGFRDAFESARAKLSDVQLPIAANDPVTRPHPVADDHFDFDAVITGSNTSGTLYKWQQLYLGSAFTGLTSSVMTSGLSDSTGAAVELNGTRFVSVGTKVRMRGSYGTDGTKFTFPAPSSGLISGKVTSNASGNGKYNGKSFTDKTSDVSGSGNLAESDFGTLSSTEDCLILNPPELGSSTTGHDVTAATNTAQFAIYFTGRVARINSDGKKVVHAMLFWAGCS